MMRILQVILLNLLVISAYADETNEVGADVVSPCVAVLMYEGKTAEVKAWHELFTVHVAFVHRYYALLEELESDNDLPQALIDEAIEECRAVYKTARSMLHE